MKYLKEVYNGEINGAQFMIEADLIQVLFHKEETTDCFDDILTFIKKPTRSQLALVPNTVRMCDLLLVTDR